MNFLIILNFLSKLFFFAHFYFKNSILKYFFVPKNPQNILIIFHLITFQSFFKICPPFHIHKKKFFYHQKPSKNKKIILISQKILPRSFRVAFLIKTNYTKKNFLYFFMMKKKSQSANESRKKKKFFFLF